jgi:hypothetical protein|eukprot:COSAG06_NODE_153_length_21876_cov_5.100628_9_plen_79_part_00
MFVPSLSWQNDMFVPSLSWQNDYDIYHLRDTCIRAKRFRGLQLGKLIHLHLLAVPNPISANASLFLSAFPMLVPSLSW